MPTATSIATELRRIADVLDKTPDVDLVKPSLDFYHGYTATKEEFLALAKIFPRPFKKSDGYSHDKVELTHETPSLNVGTSIKRWKVCTLREPARPAVYDCEPLLSQTEEAEITA